ncbi:MAG: hypothetical protein ACR2NR_12100 [Solirubrobacteraceae bacterium]
MHEPLAVLLLPGDLEGFELEAHARDLLTIPRVIALEPAHTPTPRFLRDAVSMRQARRLRLPGRLRVVVLYHSGQYPLARALCAHNEHAELWYVPSDGGALTVPDQAQTSDLLAFDELARVNACQTLPVSQDGQVDDVSLRSRLRELEVINSRAFVPGARMKGH